MLRFASFWLFLDAFNIGGSFDNVLLVMSVQAISGALPFTPGGAGAQQALLAVTLDGPTYAAVIAYSVGQQVAVTVWSVLIAFVVLGVVFRSRDWRRMLREGRAAREGDDLSRCWTVRDFDACAPRPWSCPSSPLLAGVAALIVAGVILLEGLETLPRGAWTSVTAASSTGSACSCSPSSASGSSPSGPPCSASACRATSPSRTRPGSACP